MLLGGIVGALRGFGLRVLDRGDRLSAQRRRPAAQQLAAFIPVTFELTVLFAALSAVLGMLALNGLPMPYHPVFNVAAFALASQDRFFLCIEATRSAVRSRGDAAASSRGSMPRRGRWTLT